MTISYLNSLQQLYNEDLDLVISTRYDINFFEIHLKNMIMILQNVVSYGESRVYGFTYSE